MGSSYYERTRATVPGEDIESSPGVCVFASDEYWPLIVGMLESGLLESFWDESSGDVQKAIDSVLKFATQETFCMETNYTMVCQHEALGVAGGSSVVGDNIRTFNQATGTQADTVMTNNDIFKLDQGLYRVTAKAACNRSDDSKLMLWNGSADLIEIDGLNGRYRSSAAFPQSGHVELEGTINAHQLTRYQLRHYFATAKATNGWGNAISMGTVETYAWVTFERIGEYIE